MLRRIETIEALQAEIEVADQLGVVSDAAMRQHFETFTYNMPKIDGDPFDEGYRAGVAAMYRDLFGKPVALENEHTPFDYASALKKPFPFSTSTPGLVGDYFVQVAHLIRVLNLSSGTVADMGPGWGNTSEMLARLGLDVWAVDMNPDFCRLVEARGKSIGADIRTIVGDFFAVEQTPQLDGAVFFESFHHCMDHIRLLAILREKMREGGAIVFGGEPVIRDWHAPWGLRPDGMSVWSIRKFGWLELGFDEDYFLEALLRTGWSPQRHDLAGHLPAYRAEKTNIIHPSRVTWPSFSAWAEAETDPSLTLRFTTGETTIPVGMGTSKITLRNFRLRELPVKVQGHADTLAAGEARAITVKHDCRITIESDIWHPATEFGNDDARVLGVAVESIEAV